MADKRISQLVDRGTVANNDVVPIVVSGAVTTNKATISSIQTFMQGNLDFGVTSVGITLGSSGTDVSVTGSPITTSGNITINLPTASASNRGLLSSADWITFNSKQPAGNYVTTDTVQTITAQKTFTTSGSSDTMIISHGSGSGFALDVIKAGNSEAIRVNKTSGSGNAMTVIGGNFEAPTIVKTGGTSTEFLKADGSVDNNAYVDLTSFQTINGFKTFGNTIFATGGLISSSAITITDAGGADSLEVDHTSGTGIAVDITKAGDGEGLRVTKTSGSGNAVTITGGLLSAEAATLTGALNGTSATFTAAGSTFVSTTTTGGSDMRISSGATSGFVGTTSNHPLSFVVNNGVVANFNTSGVLSLGAALNGTSAVFSGNVSVGPSASSLSSPILLVAGKNGTFANIGGLQFGGTSTSNDGNNNLISSGSYYNGTSNIATATTASIYQQTVGTHVFYSNTGLTVGSSFVNTERMRITSDGKVGIGTTAPNAILTSANTGALTLNSNDGNHTGFGLYIQAPSTTNTISSAIGFGVAQRKLAAIAMQSYSDSDQAGLNFYVQPTATGSAATLTEAMRITSAGNLGIGTTAPLANLHVRAASGAADVRIQDSSNTTTLYLQSQNGIGVVGTITNHALRFDTNDSEKMRITSAGLVGIGTPTPASSLTIVGAADYNTILLRRNDTANSGQRVAVLARNFANNQTFGVIGAADLTGVSHDILVGLDGTVGANTIAFRTAATYGATTTERMRITSGGDVLVGITSTYTNARYQSENITGTKAAMALRAQATGGSTLVEFHNPNGQIGSIQTSGSVTSYVMTSDYRLKEDLKEINGLQKVQAIKVYDYAWKSDESRMDGVLAHELAEVLPYAVHGEKDQVDEEGNDVMQGVDYSKIVPILIKAIQELKTEIDSLKNQTPTEV